MNIGREKYTPRYHLNFDQNDQHSVTDNEVIRILLL